MLVTNADFIALILEIVTQQVGSGDQEPTFPADSLILTLVSHRTCFGNPDLLHVCPGPSTLLGILFCYFSHQNFAWWVKSMWREVESLERDFHE